MAVSGRLCLQEIKAPAPPARGPAVPSGDVGNVPRPPSFLVAVTYAREHMVSRWRVAVLLRVFNPEIDQLVLRRGLDRLIAAVTRKAQHRFLLLGRVWLALDESDGRPCCSNAPLPQSRLARSRRALLMTLTEDSAIAAAAMTGERSRPNAGYRMPAATGMPATL